MVRTTRTYNPLPFQDLEPHRFEDLVRQLAYDFRVWGRLEATGRSGSDEGFDVRAIEVVGQSDIESEADDVEVQEPKVEERQWLIQCKREKVITPKKMAGYAEEIVKNDGLYGVIFSSACDFSKKTRDTLHKKLADAGVKEILIWGKGELEDMLYQPKNDNLLFAYFGVSLQVRKRSLRSQTRSKLATKRKLISVLGEIDTHHYEPVLIRDVNALDYPFEENIKDKKRFHWKRYYFIRHYYDGIAVLGRKFVGYIDDQREHWDYIPDVDFSEPYKFPTAWSDPKIKKNEVTDKKQRVEDFNEYRVDKKNRAWLCVLLLIPYERIIDIDKHGDERVKEPHIYVDLEGAQDPFDEMSFNYLDPYDKYTQVPSLSKRTKVDFFPQKIPKISQSEKDKRHAELKKELYPDN